MIVSRNLSPKIILFYSWRSLLYYLSLAISVYVVDATFFTGRLDLPFYTIAALSTALAIFLGFKNNQAYDRWWEARKIWGLMVNYSRAWARQVSTFPVAHGEAERELLREQQCRMIYRHAAFVHALRVFLRERSDHVIDRTYRSSHNEYRDAKHLLDEHEFEMLCEKDNPPNYLIQVQGEELRDLAQRGWLTEFRHVQLDQTLVEFNNIQGRSERIKNTPLPRAYSYFSRVFVFIHATILPFAFIQDLGWVMIPASFVVSFVFRSLDIIGERQEDPFENRIDDTPLTSLSVTIERNVKEQWGEKELPENPPVREGIVF